MALAPPARQHGQVRVRRTPQRSRQIARIAASEAVSSGELFHQCPRHPVDER